MAEIKNKTANNEAIVIPFWSSYYLNIPYRKSGRDFSSIDSWGLIRLIYINSFDIALPSWNNKSDEEKAFDILNSNIYYPVFSVEIGDILIIKISPKDFVFALCLGSNRAICSCKGIDSGIIDYSKEDIASSIIGIYRYKTMVQI